MCSTARLSSESIGERQILRVVGDGHVLVAMRPRRLGHFFDGIAAVGFDGVHVHVALQISLRDQRRQGMRRGRINLAQVLAQFGRNVVELELGVDFFFGFSRDRLLRCPGGPGCIR